MTRTSLYEAAMDPVSATSITERAYHKLRRALLTGELAPGAKLKIQDLCRRMDVNLSAMREALTRLAAEGMVAAEPQRGFRAAPISAEDLEDLTRVRIDIETNCLARAIEHGGIAWEAAVIAASHTLSRTPKADPAGDPAAFAVWRDAHLRYHDALCGACGSPWLLRLRDQLNAQNQRYLWLSLKLSGKARAAEADDEHLKLTAAMLDRDVDTATALVREHLWATTRNLLRSPLLTDDDDAPAGRARPRGRTVVPQGADREAA